jgi:hypothetical protein
LESKMDEQPIKVLLVDDDEDARKDAHICGRSR